MGRFHRCAVPARLRAATSAEDRSRSRASAIRIDGNRDWLPSAGAGARIALSAPGVASPPADMTSASMEKNSIVGGELMDIANGDCGWLGRSDRVVGRRNRRRPQKAFEPGRREHDEIVIFDIAGITQLVGDVARGGETIAWPKNGGLVSDDHLQFSGKHVIGLILARMRMARHHHSGRESNLQEAISSAGFRARQAY